MANKVKYGLSNVHYSVAEETLNAETGQYTYTYATPVPIKGGVNLSLEANGEQSTFRADNIDYYVTSSNNGYEGDLEVALIPDQFKIDCLGYKQDSNGVLYEDAYAKPKPFALLFQFEGDQNARRHCMYNCVAGRPSVASQTTEETIEPVTDTLNITATGRLSDGIVKSSTKDGDNTSEQYTGWFSNVYQPVPAEEEAEGGTANAGEGE